MTSESIKEIDKLISNSIKDEKRYVLLNKRYQITIGVFLLLIVLLLIGTLIFLTQSLAIQQALIAIIGILIIAALEAFENFKKDEKKSFSIPSIKLDNRTFIYGDYNSQETISNYTSNQKQDLVEAAAEIQKLLNQISETHSIQTTQEKMIIAAEVVEEIDNNPSLKEKVTSTLKVGGLAALATMIDHPVAAITIAALAAWQSNETEAQEK